jgi:predicted MFS family arabinose efflux permease
MTLGTSGLVAGVALTLLAIATSSTAGLLVGTMIAGAAFGAAFQGAIGSIVPLAAADQRAGVLSIVYVICYLAMGLPAVVAGDVVASTHNVVSAANGYGLVVIALAAMALAGTRWRRRMVAMA